MIKAYLKRNLKWLVCTWVIIMTTWIVCGLTYIWDWKAGYFFGITLVGIELLIILALNEKELQGRSCGVEKETLSVSSPETQEVIESLSEGETIKVVWTKEEIDAWLRAAENLQSAMQEVIVSSRIVSRGKCRHCQSEIEKGQDPTNVDLHLPGCPVTLLYAKGNKAEQLLYLLKSRV